MSLQARVIATLAPLGLLVAGTAAIWFNLPTYPYGRSHCCDKQLDMALKSYADLHGGNFPAGEATPEASLSLLYPNCEADILRGKNVPEETARQILEGGGKLGPTTCGWHYEAGLNKNDDRRIALFWDKNRLGHNGQLQEKQQTSVFFVSGMSREIDETGWNSFLEEQQQLLSERQAAKE